LAPLVDALGLGDTRALAWGLGWAVIRPGHLWRPAGTNEKGKAALIVPATSQGYVDDLVAWTLDGRTMLRRLGVAAALGCDEVDKAKADQTALTIYDDPASWLRYDTRGTVILDWTQAASVLDGVRFILCSEALGPKLLAITDTCWPKPTVAAWEATT
jgi:hypothetical protein